MAKSEEKAAPTALPLGATATLYGGKLYKDGEELPKEQAAHAVPKSGRHVPGAQPQGWQEMSIPGTSGSGKPDPKTAEERTAAYAKMTKDELAEEAKSQNIVVEGEGGRAPTKADYLKALGAD